MQISLPITFISIFSSARFVDITQSTTKRWKIGVSACREDFVNVQISRKRGTTVCDNRKGGTIEIIKIEGESSWNTNQLPDKLPPSSLL